MNGTSFLVNRNGYYMAAEDMEKVHNKVTIYTEKGQKHTCEGICRPEQCCGRIGAGRS